MARSVRTYIIASLAILLLFFGGSIIVSIKYNLQSMFFGQEIRENIVLREENLALRAALDLSQDAELFISGIAERVIPAHVFSTYPYNIKNRLSIDVGQNHGIENKDAVVQNGILIGQIIEVRDTSSIVRTIFDPNWEFAVRVGEQSVDALLRGGSAPRLTFIPKDTEIASGDVIVSSFAGIPYGIAIGTVGEISSTDGPFLEAHITLPYNINRLHMVGVVRAKHDLP